MPTRFLPPVVLFACIVATFLACDPDGTSDVDLDDGGSHEASASDLAPSPTNPWAGIDAGSLIPDSGPSFDASSVTPVFPDANDPTEAFDAGEAGVCTDPLAAGDLVITELMVSSVAGTGDHGEWLEVTSTLPCATNLNGLHAETPKGSTVVSIDVSDDLWISPGGTFVIADSAEGAVNHYLPGLVIAWPGNAGDVLRNLGGTVSLFMAGVLVDSVTYPDPKLTGGSLAFPADCAPSTRASFANWSPSVASWFPGFLGTPNTPNTDVTCPGTAPDRR